MRYDVATALNRGKRDYQEDALVADFPVGADVGYAVLADGMGGHAAGDIASKIVVTEVFSELKFQTDNPREFEKNVSTVLMNAASAANACIEQHVADAPENEGMGSTLVAPIFFRERLYWISVGDSPLYLFRRGALRQLNEDHSMAPQIDIMVKTGQIDEETARSHPDRNCLTSVLMGGRIPKIDCSGKPMELQVGDVLIAASDGLQFLTDDQICRILTKNRKRPSSQIADAFLDALHRLNDPDQDNVSFTIVKVL